MGIFDRLFHRPPQHETTGAYSSERAALAHDEAADAYGDEIERIRQTQDRLTQEQRSQERLTQERRFQEEADRRAAENMTAEGDPWD
ncbi:hypothetical protein [Streptomyces sp. NRRL S-350]|uniref:hypothetical protein n=1 Tax=Streptomyces sp. NRRL S-350 TaxID=1463902 RepID=UPI0004C1D3FC|nr:hypothetical protein [Streptomyces sp. NRRL S-350]